jgi:hypothetical protein
VNLPGHHRGPELDVKDHVLERCAQRPVSDIERLIELRVGQAAAQVQETCRGPVVVSQQAIKQIHPISLQYDEMLEAGKQGAAGRLCAGELAD